MFLVVLGILFLLIGGAGVVLGVMNPEALAKLLGEKVADLGSFAPLFFIVVGGIFALIGLVMLIVGLKSKPRVTVLQLVESAIMIGVATGLSFVKFDLPYGGGVTLVSMLPIIIISHRYGPAWGIFTAFVYSVLQLMFGLDNVGYATNAVMAVGVILLDYILAYTVIGLSGIFGQSRGAVAGGICFTFALRFLCHYVTGVWIWKEWMPEKFMGMTMKSPWIYSGLYNGWYMLVELAVTLIIAMLIYKPLEKYFTNGDAK